MYCNILVTLNEIYLLIFLCCYVFCPFVIVYLNRCDKKTIRPFKTLCHSTFWNKCVILTTNLSLTHPLLVVSPSCLSIHSFIASSHCRSVRILACRLCYNYSNIWHAIESMHLLIDRCDIVALRIVPKPWLSIECRHKNYGTAIQTLHIPNLKLNPKSKSSWEFILWNRCSDMIIYMLITSMQMGVSFSIILTFVRCTVPNSPIIRMLDECWIFS